LERGLFVKLKIVAAVHLLVTGGEETDKRLFAQTVQMLDA